MGYVQRRSVQNAKAAAKKRAAYASGPASKKRARARKRELTIYLIEALAALVVIVGVIAGIFIWKASFTKVLLSDYLVVETEGYDHFGTASVHMDVDPAFADFWSTVEVKADKTENLSNGDTLDITFTYEADAAKKSKLKIDDTAAAITINDLTPQIRIDHEKLFSGLQITKEGLSPRVSLDVENISEDPFVSQITYVVNSEKIFFADGEEAVITAEIPEEFANSHEYAFELGEENNNYSYLIEEPDSYVTDASLITEDVLSQLEDEGLKLLLNSDANEYGLRIFQQEAHIQAVFVGNKTTFRWENAYMISAYFHGVTAEGLQFIENHTNDVQIVYGVTITQQNGAKAFAEAVIQFTNIIQRADGTIDLSESPGRLVSCTYKDKNVKALVSGGSEKYYDTTKLTK